MLEGAPVPRGVWHPGRREAARRLPALRRALVPLAARQPRLRARARRHALQQQARVPARPARAVVSPRTHAVATDFQRWL